LEGLKRATVKSSDKNKENGPFSSNEGRIGNNG